MRISKTPGVPLEYDEAIIFADWLRGQQIPFFHCPNEVGGSSQALRVRAIKMKRMGVSAGVPDLFVFLPVKGVDDKVDCYQMCVIEMKRIKGSTTSQAQKEWLKIIEKAGIPCAVCKGAEAAIKFVQQIIKEIEGEE